MVWVTGRHTRMFCSTKFETVKFGRLIVYDSVQMDMHVHERMNQFEYRLPSVVLLRLDLLFPCTDKTWISGFSYESLQDETFDVPTLRKEWQQPQNPSYPRASPKPATGSSCRSAAAYSLMATVGYLMLSHSSGESLRSALSRPCKRHLTISHNHTHGTMRTLGILAHARVRPWLKLLVGSDCSGQQP